MKSFAADVIFELIQAIIWTLWKVLGTRLKIGEQKKVHSLVLFTIVYLLTQNLWTDHFLDVKIKQASKGYVRRLWWKNQVKIFKTSDFIQANFLLLQTVLSFFPSHRYSYTPRKVVEHFFMDNFGENDYDFHKI